MISNNRELSEINDAITFQTVPLFGLESVSSFTDNLTNVTSTKFFKKEFCYSFDGIVYTDWMLLGAPSFSLLNHDISINSGVPVIRFKYTRIGTDSTNPPLIFNSVSLQGKYAKPVVNFQSSKRTIFKDLVYDNIDVYNLMVNLTQKMYEEGVLPTYLERNEKSNDLYEDKDYIDFWSAVSKFFALFFIHSYSLKNIYWRKELLAEYVKQKNIYFSDDDNIIELQLLAQNIFDEIRQRGTSEIFRKKDFEYPIGQRFRYKLPVGYNVQPSTPIYIDGIKYSEPDELPFGWIVLDGWLVSPDKNYHSISNLSPDEVNEILVGGDFNNDFNNDFAIGGKLVFTTGKELLPATLESGIKKQFNGEYLRLINYNEVYDEFIYNQVNTKDFGWNLGNSSPMYRGLRPQTNKTLVKAYEENEDFFDLSKYPIL